MELFNYVDITYVSRCSIIIIIFILIFYVVLLCTVYSMYDNYRQIHKFMNYNNNIIFFMHA